MSVMKSHPRRRWLFPLWGLLGLLLMAGFFARSRFRPAAPAPTWPRIQQAVEAKQWDEAEPMLERWISDHPRHGEALMILADLRIHGGRPQDARTLLQGIRESSPAWVQAQLMLGELAIRDRLAAEAEAVFRRLAALEPTAIPTRQRLVYLMSLQQRTAELRDQLWQIARITGDPKVLVDLVLELLLEQEDVRGIGPELAAFLEKTPGDPFLRRAWGLALLYQGKATEALPHLEAAAGALANDPRGRFALAECRILLGLSVDAATVLGTRPEGETDAASWWVYRGRLEESLGSREQAAGAFKKAIALQPDCREAHFRLGHLLEQTGLKAEARKELVAAEALGERLKAVRREFNPLRKQGLPRDAKLYYRLGKLCLDARLIAEARAWFEAAVSVAPTLAEARVELETLARTPDTLPIALARPILREAPEVLESKGEIGNVRTSRGPRFLFEEVSARAGLMYRYDCGASDRLFLAETMGGGVGLIDHDGDGWLDIYFVNGCSIPFDPANPPSPNRLFRNHRDGTFRDVTASAGVGGRGYGMGCTVGDYDNDGHDDLFVTGLDRTVLYRNRGDGTFEDVTAKAGLASNRWTTAAGFGDLDGDGDLDLVVITYVSLSPHDRTVCRDGAGHPMHCPPARFPAQQDLLFRNEGNGTFTEVSRSAGFEAPGGRGLGLAIADFDDDGKLDVFVANDSTPDFLFRNLGSLRFEEIGVATGVATKGSGQATASMGVVAGDLDGDGRIDLFITNLVNESSTYFRNLGQWFFQDATLGAGLEAPSRSKTGFGDAALDVDNDGKLDLFVANGDVDDRPWANNPMAQTPFLFRNRGASRFELVRDPSAGPYFDLSMVGRGVAVGDLNNDGRQDLVVIRRDGAVGLLENRTAGGHWLGVQLVGKRSGRTPVGAQVTCRSGKWTITRWVTSGTGYLSSHDQRVWIGMGSVEVIDELEVRWPSSLVQTWRTVGTDRIVEIEEGRIEMHEKKGGPGVETRTAPQ